jgi:hypothetical protein
MQAGGTNRTDWPAIIDAALVFILDCPHVIVGKAEMMTELMDDDVSDYLLETVSCGRRERLAANDIRPRSSKSYSFNINSTFGYRDISF